MIKLRLIGSSADQEHLVFSSQKKGRRGSHLVEIDDKLFHALEDVVRKRRAKEKGETVRARRVEPKLAPRDIQRLLRMGRPVDQVAKQAGVDAAWVERFLGPILDERAVAVKECQQARLEKQRLGLSGAVLGEAVARNLKARRVNITDRELDQAWDASRGDGQPWLISLTFPFRGREQRATWRYDPLTREVTAGNRLGSDIGWVPDGRRAGSSSRAGSPAKKAAKSTTARAKPARRRAPARKSPARRPAARRKTAPRKPAARRKPAAKRPARKKPSARRVARKPARRPTSRRPARRPTSRRPATRRRSRR